MNQRARLVFSVVVGSSRCNTHTDSCSTRSLVCGEHAVSTSLADGTLVCACLPGFAADCGVCVDIDECATRNGGCDPHATCANTVG